MAICVTYRRTDSDDAFAEPAFAAYSGTLIRIRDSICLLTAGHVLAELDAWLRDERIEILETVLVDTFGAGRVDDHPIPFALRNARLYYIDDRDEGLDFGVIVLEPHYVRLLAANRVIALGEENWIHQPGLQFDAYVMFGLPQEFTSSRVSDSGEGLVSPTMFRVTRIASAPVGSRLTRHPRFVGQIDHELPLRSVEGMSGGPIFGFRTGTETRYWIVALQSTWLPDRRIVFGCPLPVLASLLTEWAEQGTPA